MQLIKELFSVNEILTVSIVSWFVAQVLKTIINFILLGKFQLERMWGDGGMPSAHSATVCAMVIAAARSEGISSAIFAVASVVAIITMHDAMGDRRTSKGAQPDDRGVDRHQRKKRSLPSEYASEGDGRTHAAAGHGRHGRRRRRRLFVSDAPLIRSCFHKQCPIRAVFQKTALPAKMTSVLKSSGI